VVRKSTCLTIPQSPGKYNTRGSAENFPSSRRQVKNLLRIITIQGLDPRFSDPVLGFHALSPQLAEIDMKATIWQRISDTLNCKLLT
jgi:hypothetical protein